MKNPDYGPEILIILAMLVALALVLAVSSYF
jgi:hypothetical protein